MPNIVTKVGKNGKTTYQAVVRVDVKRPIKRTFNTYEEAETWRVETDAAERAKLAADLEKAHTFTFAEVLEDYTAHNSVGALERLTASLSDFMSKPLDNLALADLENLGKYELDLVEDVIEHGRRFFGCVLEENPVAALKARREALPFRPITAYEEDTLIEEAGSKTNVSLHDVLILAFDTGLSLHEIFEIDARYVDLNNGLLSFANRHPIPLTARSKEVLERRMSKHTGSLLQDAPRNTVQTAYIRLRKNLGINGPDFNDIRKIAIIRLSEKMSLADIKDALGYVSWESLGWLIKLQATRAK
ncbi:hypothetical protein R6138_04564 [Ralstonia thomasii]|uniref:hypothetical protein n=1 Tax=Ralstonia thomasii TaxID=3058596 RepID=UPI0028F6335E|nr:hypothetical protein [Ralstonia sp. LMG 18095]CAJ0901313.1 hypothetical protein R6138_04564 [Ralstonia sp. LMG 18095]